MLHISNIKLEISNRRGEKWRNKGVKKEEIIGTRRVGLRGLFGMWWYLSRKGDIG